MGFEIYYRSTEVLESDKAAAALVEANQFCSDHTWLSYEPIFLSDDEDGHLSGGSKPTFQPDPGDPASAAAEGTVSDLLEGLCMISRVHGIDWEIGHDAEPEPIGFIRGGVADDTVVGQVEAIRQMLIAAAESTDEPEAGDDVADPSAEFEDNRPGDDEPPPPLKLFVE